MWWRFAVAAMAVLHVLVGWDCARRWSATHDEYWHLPAGLAAWREGRFDVDNLNPPLTRMWDSIPLALGGASLPRGLPADDAFLLGDEFLKANSDRYQLWLTLARGMNLLLSAAMGVLLAIWGRETFGAAAGLIAAALWLTCPICLSNGALVTPDAGATLLFAATLYFTQRFARSPTWGSSAVVGILLGLGQLTKFTNILLFGFVPLVWGVTRYRAQLPAVSIRRALPQWSILIVAAFVVWNAGYLFHGTGRRLGAWEFRSQAMRIVQSRLAALSNVPVPLPADYLAGFDRQRSIMEGSHPVYLNGVWNLEGFPYYYGYCALYKWPHATQLGLLLGALTAFSVWGRKSWRTNLVLLIPAVVVVGVASGIGMQLGFRYILPAFPLLYLFAGQAAQWCWESRSVWGRVAVTAFALALPLGLRDHPHHLAYFNELSGGFAGGRAHLADSNLDWGQDLLELRVFLKSQEVDHVGLAYFGMLPPSALGFDYELPPSAAVVAGFGRPPAGWYAISVNFTLGRPHTIRNPDNSIRGAGFQEFGYFRQMKPVKTIGGSIDVFHVEARSRR
ncbi:MAG: glycosyltransferase family 39 protein [Planctomycetota bacterium]|nr:glycosyltransferase family 39 protein [Planctomycetota bacterium]